MTDRTNPEHSAPFTPNMKTPNSAPKNRRGLFGFLLTLLLPPIGLIFLWREGVFRTRGRVVLTTLAMVEMTALIALLLPKSQLTITQPLAVAPPAVTAAPVGENLTALSNIDELLAAQQAAEIAAAADQGATLSPEASAAAAEAAAAEQEAIKNTIVYSVYSNAKYYHSVEVCGTQANRRQLTVGEAMSEGLAVCPNCNPPVYTGTNF